MGLHNKIILAPIDTIEVDWEKRYASGDWNDQTCENLRLAFASGQPIINPITVFQDDNNRLSLDTGGHRLQAFIRNRDNDVPCPHKSYANWTLIPARPATDLTTAERHQIEIVENIIRRNLPWLSRARKIHDLHEHMRQNNSQWLDSDTTAALQISADELVQTKRVIRLLESADPSDQQSIAQLSQCPSLRSASDLAHRRFERKRQEELESLRTPSISPQSGDNNTSMETSEAREGIVLPAPDPFPLFAPATPPPPCPILHQELSDFIATYSGPRFSLVHCDPPYGENLSKINGQGVRKDWEAYEDSPSALWDFLPILRDLCLTHVADSAHMVLWFPIPEYCALHAWFDEHMLDWTVDPIPLVWHISDSTGTAPAPGRSGRRNLEMALLCTRGDRPTVRVSNMGFSHPRERQTRIHQSEKPRDVVAAFCSMLVDDTTVAIDPTAGSGRPLQAILSLGAKSVLGLERVSSIHHLATQDWRRWELQREEERAASALGGDDII